MSEPDMLLSQASLLDLLYAIQDRIPEGWNAYIAYSAGDTSGWVCQVCGCTDECGCEGGCFWVEKDLCSVCAAKTLEGVRP